jgi:hypothetical protein
VAASVALACAIVIAWNGGIRQNIGPVLISARDWWRTAAAALALYVISLLLARRDDVSLPWRGVLAVAEKSSAMVAAGAAAAILAFGLTSGARTAGGADALGYVSQAYLWLKGDLRIAQPLGSIQPWPFTDESVAPLGYKPGVGASRHTSVPTYAPGLPLIMAGSLVACGPCGPFYLGPLFAALLVWCTWGLAQRLSGDGLTSALAALWMATSPTLLFNLVIPMSDAVAATLWIASLVLLTWPLTVHAAASGLVAGLAILVRPNLVPLVLAGALAAELWNPRARRGRRSLTFLICVVPAVVIVGVVNRQLYGSPLLSGYGPSANLYSLEWFPRNLWLYAAWLVESQGAIVLLALLPLVVPRMRPAWLTPARALPIAVYIALLCTSYLFYIRFDAWWFLRFFLPAFPVLFLFVAGALAWLTRQAPAVVAVPVLIMLVTWLSASSVGFALEKGARVRGEGEQRYAAVAQYIDRELPSTAVIIAKEHTGTIAFYTGRQTLRRDYLPRQRLRDVAEWLQANGRRPYIVLEDWEEVEYRRHFAEGQDALSRLDVRIVAETIPPQIRVRIYDPLAPAAPDVRPVPIPAPPARECATGRGAWRP